MMVLIGSVHGAEASIQGASMYRIRHSNVSALPNEIKGLEIGLFFRRIHICVWWRSNREKYGEACMQARGTAVVDRRKWVVP